MLPTTLTGVNRAGVDLTVGNKADGNKVRLDLLPPAALVEVAKTLTFGAIKYEAWNWSKGMKASRLFAATLRHMWAWFCGESVDPETGLSHLAHAGFGILVMLDLELREKAQIKFDPTGFRFDDRPVGLCARPDMIFKKDTQ